MLISASWTHFQNRFIGAIALSVAISGCSKASKLVVGADPSPTPTEVPADPTATPSPAASAMNCPSIPGTPWAPTLTGVASENHSDSVNVSKTVYTGNGLLTSLDSSYDPAGSHVITINNIDMSSDLGNLGSLSIVAEVTNFPADMKAVGGQAWPVLVSLSDGAHELVNVTGCNSGFYSCAAGGCSLNAACGPKAPTAFLGSSDSERQGDWEQHELNGSLVSVNTFPTCNWSATATPSCAFTSDFFVGGKLKTGTYTAKYVLLTNFSGIGDKYPAGLKLSVIRKTDSAMGGAIDVNVVLVGSQNIVASRTSKGKQNLNALFGHVYDHYFTSNPSSTGVKLGRVNVFEWDCANGGDAYANISSDKIGDLFATGSKLLPSTTEAHAINLFLVTTIPYSGSGTVLGLSGGILGAMVNGTTESGVAISTFNHLDSYNPSCNSSGSCPTTSQEVAFLNLGSTVSHEMGHFFGLNHPSESAGTLHDLIPDTPTCTTTSSSGMITINSCLSEAACSAVCSAAQYASNPYCADKSECQFNHVMWWTSKNYNSSGQGDGNIFSTNSGALINFSPYVQ